MNLDHAQLDDFTEEELDTIAELAKKHIIEIDENEKIHFILKPGTFVSYPAERGEYGFAEFIRLEGGIAILKSCSYDKEIVSVPIMQICNQEA